MSFYVDCRVDIPYNGSTSKSNTRAANEIAKMFVANAGFTLIQMADEANGSGSAIVEWKGMRFELSSGTSQGNISVKHLYSNGTLIYNATNYFRLLFKDGVTTTVHMRFCRTKYGGFFACVMDVGGLMQFAWGAQLERISDSELFYASALTSVVGINDGAYVVHSAKSSADFYDETQTVQVLINIMVSRISNTDRGFAFISKDIFLSGSIISRGVFSIGGRAFFAPFRGNTIAELSV